MKNENHRPSGPKACRACYRAGWPLVPILLVALVLGGCAGGGSRSADGSARRLDPDKIPDAVPRVEPRSRYGNPDTYVVFGRRYRTRSSSRGFVERGVASWYGPQFHGRKTSSGEPYDMYSMTAAHKSLPLPTYVRVTNLDNGRSAVVRVNDRGPFHGGRVIDLSYAAATKLDLVRHGTARVEVRAIDPRRRDADPGPFLARAGKGPAAGTSHRSGVVAHRGPRQQERVAHREPRPTPAERRAEGRTARALDAALAATGAQRVAVADHKASRRSVAGATGLYLQVGAFGDRRNAERLRQRLLAHVSGKVRVLRPGPGAGPTLYKVRVGPFGSEREASLVSAKLVTLGVDRPSPVWN